ncbi:16S rRNA (cytidine(1402)-2'-O)-methyltransferase [Euhalothece natronophila Z-M001]|uniref:Ribosomal RNA small subunit methyltransferase I n=1 Tax=Euhalothece natronophila Z-M001 TaxID=522448 RepID=A0A5B8NID9_9CHRO|nr:16S rRNA (cytidine(1402)-2'-O)-methyltransferase [Euhalothece natronophila]QDZ38706.1 16S rRNA (cytidine(1402)-2'-O)-methyltransferase [Euhalothece natronophila Z-M001]
MTGKLYLVGTPIGNLEDMTFRAVNTLKTVDLIAAEDTRHTGKLLQHYEITTSQISYHDHNRKHREAELIKNLKQGKNVALVTDAGMPAISDPGYDLVKACLEANISVIPIPGVTASITALAVSGLPTNRFIFEGFLPVKGKAREERLNVLKSETRTIILYESPHKLKQTLQNLGQYLGKDRLLMLGRELTKRYEEFLHLSLKEAISFYEKQEPKGEYTIVISGKEKDESLNLTSEELKTELRELLAQGVTRSQASRQLAKISSLSRQEIYQLSMELDEP